MFRSLSICVSSSALRVNILIKQMSDSAVSTIHWSNLKCLLMYMHILDWDDEFFIRWKKLCAELNDYKSLLLQSCFCIATMSNSRTSLLIKNDSWIFNNFLMLYCRIHRKDCSVIKLFVAVVDSAMKRLFVCFWSLRIFFAFWLNVSESAQMSSHLSRYSRKRKNWLISSWSLLFIKLIQLYVFNMIVAKLERFIESKEFVEFEEFIESKEFKDNEKNVQLYLDVSEYLNDLFL